jgi:hypothetical protein
MIPYVYIKMDGLKDICKYVRVTAQEMRVAKTMI